MQLESGLTRWAQIQERGTFLGLSSLLWIYKAFGINAMYFALYFIVGFHFIFASAARKSSIDFLRKLHCFMGDKSPWRAAPSLFHSYLHFLSFAQIACDKIIVWLGHYKFEELKISGYEEYQNYQQQGKGCLLIVSHLGNIDILRAFADGFKKMNLTVLVHNAHAPKFQRMMSKVSGRDSTIDMIEVQNITPDVIIHLRQKIDSGGTVAISGDRTAVESSGRYQLFDFLGDKAPFAQGPFILAELLECPTFAVFSMKENGIYHAFFHTLEKSFRTSRKERAQNLTKLMNQYVRLLEGYTCLYPMQWFNFYNYWKAPSE